MTTYRIRTKQGTFDTQGHNRADAIRRFRVLFSLRILTIIPIGA